MKRRSVVNQTYVTLVRLRESQQSSPLQSPDQIIKDAVAKSGGKLLSAHATLGFYDIVMLTEFPDQQSAFKCSTSLKVNHNWITETNAAETLAQFGPIYQEVAREGAGASSRNRG